MDVTDRKILMPNFDDILSELRDKFRKIMKVNES